LGRYSCQQGKVVGIGKTNKFCLIRRCPDLIVMYRTRAGKKWHNEYKKQFPVGVVSSIGC